ncbi:MAG: malate synthase A [SAR324 cluster bacterium]|nr:malate synthase A [SAR324 cluster bacterium]
MPGTAWNERSQRILTPEALALVADLHRRFESERQSLMRARREFQAAWNAGETPNFLDRDSEAATGDWKVGEIPEDLLCRRVEITGPSNSPKMVINMLSRRSDGSRADTAMLDFEDALKPSWRNIVDGMINIRAVADGSLEHLDPPRPGREEKLYRLDPEDQAVMIIRPRGLHLVESNLRVDGEPVSAALFDMAVSFHHTARNLVDKGKTPAYYIPKCEHYLEARWWNQLFTAMEKTLGVEVGTLKATFLIETLPAAFQMEEILFEFREHAAGLNVGRWDKIFSDIKTLGYHENRVLADRAAITMTQPWMADYALRCVQICHQRGAFGMGGMAAFTPGKTAEIRDRQLAKVLEDKLLEASTGHDGCWVSHPYFIAEAMKAFPRKNQLDVMHEGRDKYPDLLPQAIGPRTMNGLRTNVRVGIGYLEGWNRDIGCVAWDNLMEDLATLEISRAQTWQWLHHGITLDDGTPVTEPLVRQVFGEELGKIVEDEAAEIAEARGESRDEVAESFASAGAEAEEIFTRGELTDFLCDASPLEE